MRNQVSIYIYTGLVEYHGLFLFLNLQVKTYKSSHFSSYFLVKLVKKEPYISPSAFDHFAVDLQDHVRSFVAVSFIFIRSGFF